MEGNRTAPTGKQALVKTTSRLSSTNCSRGTRGPRTHRFEADARKAVEFLGLEWSPIAAKFSAHSEGTGDSSRKLAICEALDVAKSENLVLSLSKVNCSCFGGKHFTGLEIIPVETLASALTKENHRIFESKDAALASIRKQPQPVKRGEFLSLGPLEKFAKDPDLVFLFVNPAQADIMLGLLSFRGAEPFTYYPASNICSTITNVLAKNRPEINLIAPFERTARKWSVNELILAMLFKDFEEAIENISKSAYGSFGTIPTEN